MVGTNKALGQHWLNNRAILDQIADLSVGRKTQESASEHSEKTGVETCLEIGPGLGFLTSSLLKRFDKVIAVEFDADLAMKLPGSFPGTNLEVVSGDILEFDFSAIKQPYVVAGNIPYYITSPIIEKVLTCSPLPERVVLLMQKEVAERITASKETMLSLFVKNRAKVWAGPVVKKEEFTPPPKVDSQVLVMEPFANGPKVEGEVFELIRAGFRAPRKKLIHNLAGQRAKEELERILEKSGISKDARPGDVGLEGWERLYKALR